MALGVAVVAWMPAEVRASIADDSPSAVTLPSGNMSTEATSIRKVLETYIRAVEAKDVDMFRTVKPNLSEDEEKRARMAFKSIQSQVVKMNVLALDVKDGKATVKVSRRDTINGSIVSSFPQTFQLAKEPAGWTIQDIGR
ncbi:MAG TPA: hypothetical protein VFK70_02590 [Vicinamibacteria bacterium]|nr:hypothetical protein [Vicinamibacteria bacterium]